MAALEWGGPDMSAAAAQLASPPPDFLLAADCCYVDPGALGLDSISLRFQVFVALDVAL